MDMQKIGSFLVELRKEHNLTQEELGKKIGVTNKTISRWETGRYLPPVEMLQILGELYGVSINEILSGERLNETDYKDNAEKNIVTALKRNKRTNWIIAIVVAAVYLSVSIIFNAWAYTWVIWVAYAIYRFIAK